MSNIIKNKSAKGKKHDFITKRDFISNRDFFA